MKEESAINFRRHQSTISFYIKFHKFRYSSIQIASEIIVPKQKQTPWPNKYGLHWKLKKLPF